YHFSLITSSACCPTLPFFVPAYRKHGLNTLLSIVHSTYKAFDYFQLSPDLSTISLSVSLLLPLIYMLTDVPDDHWLHKHPLSPARLRAPHSTHLFPPITSSSLHTFWSVTIHLPARTVWYPVLYRKIPASSFLSNLQLTSSNICRLCNAAIDTLDHFITLCPLKLPIWSSLLQTAFPDVHFSPDAILQLLLYLQPPTGNHQVDIPQLFAIAGTIL
ncbi:MAG: hypothetical protein EXX96DRAFT_590306, partial [Benjaminiella poitrasii]